MTHPSLSVTPFFLVWNPGHTTPSHKHIHHSNAKAEALRLASLHPGQEFFVLSVTGRAKRVEPMDWTPVLTSEITESPKSW